MRSPVIGLFFAEDPTSILLHAKNQALITHAHPLGQESSVIIARATAAALSDQAPREILTSLKALCLEEKFFCQMNIAGEMLCSADVGPDAVKENLGNGIAATNSVVTSVYIALRFFNSTFEAMLRFIAEVGGDVDTIGAMAGAIFGARNGIDVLPQDEILRLEQSEYITKTAMELYQARIKTTQDS